MEAEQKQSDRDGGEVVQVEIPAERADRVIHTLEQLSIGATDEQDEDIGMVVNQLKEAGQ
jgi:hypothetical protein